MSEAVQVPTWTLGWRLQRALDWAGLTTLDMAAELGVSRSTVSRWCNDRGAPPRVIYLRVWAARCGVPVVWLQYGDEGLPRVDSNHQPAGWGHDHRGLAGDHGPPDRGEILAFRRSISTRRPVPR